MKVPLLDLKKQYEEIRDEVGPAINDFLVHQQFILGPVVEELEEKVAAYCQCHYAIGVSSGTDALLISLMTAGVGQGDIVITTPYTFFSTVGVIARLGARPIFVDIDESTYNIDPAKLDKTILSLDERQRARIKAVIPVHLFGQCADMKPILEVGERHGLTIIEDAAQAIGAEYVFGDETVRRSGSMGQYGCFSFFPSKNLGGFGDGGMVTTNDREIYDQLKILRVHGAKPKYYHNVIGGNFRLDALQAAVLIIKLKYLDKWTMRRRENAALYRKLFQQSGLEFITLPEDKGKRHVYNQFVIKVKDPSNIPGSAKTGLRDRLKIYLNKCGIGSEIYYPVPLHMQKCFGFLGYRPEDFPLSREAACETLALPVYPELAAEQLHYVVDMIKDFFAQA
ncbi:MAG: DegT/DnrJ/EryC1/StrS family aminotransferase [Thermodesulfobacteriota bacterium]|nr:DegT/DnrJ/EryC1/StrS family aminotransferase [Thermodesulfobacteriota bacterium]